MIFLISRLYKQVSSYQLWAQRIYFFVFWKKVPDQTISTIVLHKAVVQICRLINCHCLDWIKFAVVVVLNLVYQKYYTWFYSLAGNMEIFFTNLNVSFGFANRIKYDFISMRGRIWCFFHINQFRMPFPDGAVQIPRVN